MATNSLTFLVGHPVPYSLTVQRHGRSVPARRYVEAIRAHLRAGSGSREPIITRIEGAYVFYDYAPEGFARPRLTFAPIDLGFDPRAHNMAVEYPMSAGSGPVVIEYSADPRRTGRAEEKRSRLCDSRVEALRLLRRHGYRVIEPGDGSDAFCGRCEMMVTPRIDQGDHLCPRCGLVL